MKWRKYACFLSFIIIFSLMICFLCPNNTDFQTCVESVEILPLKQYQIDSITNRIEFEDVKLNKEISQRIENNVNDFRVVEIQYYFNNRSETIDMIDLRINYLFPDKLKNKVVAYNDGHTVMNIFLDHCNTFRMTQCILLDVSNLTEEETREAIYSSKCKISYFTGPFNWSKGDEYKGIGKKTILYQLSEIWQQFGDASLSEQKKQELNN